VSQVKHMVDIFKGAGMPAPTWYTTVIRYE